MVDTASKMLEPVYEAMSGFGDEAHRTYDEFSRTREGMKVLNDPTVISTAATKSTAITVNQKL